jgi:hypothetical protein
MSETEDAATTLARLLRTKLRVIKDDGALADVSVTGEWQNTEAFKNHDGQVTVGLAEGTDQKLELSGKKRRRLQVLRVNIWATDAAGSDESGRTMRRKIVEEVIRVVRQNRVKPNETLYDFFPSGSVAGQQKAFTGTSEISPTSQGWVELGAEDYAKLWYSDDNRVEIAVSENGGHAVMLSRFKVESREKAVTKMVLSFEGYGTAPGGDGFSVKVWNHEAEAWENAVTGGAGGVDEAVAITPDSDLPDYVDGDGYVWLLAQTINASDGETAAVLRCDYVSLTVTVNGVIYCDILSFRDADRVDVKPFVYRTEITVKSWFFENTGE